MHFGYSGNTETPQLRYILDIEGIQWGYSTYTVGIHCGNSGDAVGIWYLYRWDTFLI